MPCEACSACGRDHSVRSEVAGLALQSGWLCAGLGLLLCGSAWAFIQLSRVCPWIILIVLGIACCMLDMWQRIRNDGLVAFLPSQASHVLKSPAFEVVQACSPNLEQLVHDWLRVALLAGTDMDEATYQEVLSELDSGFRKDVFHRPLLDLAPQSVQRLFFGKRWVESIASARSELATRGHTHGSYIGDDHLDVSLRSPRDDADAVLSRAADNALESTMRSRRGSYVASLCLDSATSLVIQRQRSTSGPRVSYQDALGYNATPRGNVLSRSPGPRRRMPRVLTEKVADVGRNVTMTAIKQDIDPIVTGALSLLVATSNRPLMGLPLRITAAVYSRIIPEKIKETADEFLRPFMPPENHGELSKRK